MEHGFPSLLLIIIINNNINNSSKPRNGLYAQVLKCCPCLLKSDGKGIHGGGLSNGFCAPMRFVYSLHNLPIRMALIFTDWATFSKFLRPNFALNVQMRMMRSIVTNLP
jgi:hypothetical protein